MGILMCNDYNLLFHVLYVLLFCQLYDQAAVAEIVLHNTGKVGLNFVVLNVDSGNKLIPGAPNVSPVQGHIKALSHQTLTVKYLPGVPEKFEKTFQVRISLLKTLCNVVVGQVFFIGHKSRPLMD